MDERNNNKNLQEELMREIENLKGTQQRVMSRPGTASAEVGQIRQERDNLMIENKNLKSQIAQQNSSMKDMLSQGQGPAGPSSGNNKALASKVKHYETMLA